MMMTMISMIMRWLCGGWIMSRSWLGCVGGRSWWCCRIRCAIMSNSGILDDCWVLDNCWVLGNCWVMGRGRTGSWWLGWWLSMWSRAILSRWGMNWGLRRWRRRRWVMLSWRRVMLSSRMRRRIVFASRRRRVSFTLLWFRMRMWLRMSILSVLSWISLLGVSPSLRSLSFSRMRISWMRMFAAILSESVTLSILSLALFSTLLSVHVVNYCFSIFLFQNSLFVYQLIQFLEFLIRYEGGDLGLNQYQYHWDHKQRTNQNLLHFLKIYLKLK